MRQEEKQAAAARELLDAAGRRERRAAAVHARKGSSLTGEAMQKARQLRSSGREKLIKFMMKLWA